MKIKRQRIYINAPRDLVFQMLSAMGRGQMPGANGESARVLSREGDTMIVHFSTRAGNRLVNTVEEVKLYSPQRITFDHLAGPLDHSHEEFVLSEEDNGTSLEHFGEFDYKFPLMGWLISYFYIRPRYNAVIREHMKRLKAAAEARAARSHVFRQQEE